MKQKYVQYIVGVLMLLFAIYQGVKEDWWEFSLYASAGAAFITMGLIKNDQFPEYKRLLNIASWILIVLAGFLLLFLVRTDG